MLKDKDKLEQLKFDSLRNAIYHASRKSFLDWLNKFLSLIIILAGASAVGDLGAHFHVDAKWLAFIAAAGGAFQLVFDFGVRAREHEFLQRRYYELIATMSEKTEPTVDDLATWEADLNRLYSEEPPPMRALDAIAYNAAVESLGKDKRIEVRWYHTLFAQIWQFNQSEFPYLREHKHGASS
jgi:hypothetical protein